MGISEIGKASQLINCADPTYYGEFQTSEGKTTNHDNTKRPCSPCTRQDPRNKNLIRMFIEYRNEIIEDMVLCEVAPCDAAQLDSSDSLSIPGSQLGRSLDE